MLLAPAPTEVRDPMPHRSLAAAALALCACAAAVSGCTTPRAEPKPSSAVVEARARLHATAAACLPGADISPVTVAFAFDEATVTEDGQRNLQAAVKWLACNPGVETVILPEADAHGDDAHLAGLASQRAQAAQDMLRTLGAKEGVVRIVARGKPDPVTGPHLVIRAVGRGW